ncbi:hypothetical protein GCM10010357_42660 [Streptomyces luteireticuli]|uniref:Uncharacterized protein n=2 Tax=Streptomyces luteireticuli TaxID=173858 RepID=A0ABN0YX24_9ACTN
MHTSRTTLALTGTAVLVATAAVTGWAAHARVPVTLNVTQSNGNCNVSWTKPGLTFTPATPGTGTSSYALTNGTGTVTIDLAQATDPVALAKSVSMGGSFSGGFTLTDAAGRSLQISDGQATAPTGGASYVVRTPSRPAGVRIPVYVYESPTMLVPQVSSLLPPKVSVAVTEAKVDVTPEFAQALNTTFGAGTVSSGAPFGSCTANVVT